MWRRVGGPSKVTLTGHSPLPTRTGTLNNTFAALGYLEITLELVSHGVMYPWINVLGARVGMTQIILSP